METAGSMHQCGAWKMLYLHPQDRSKNQKETCLGRSNGTNLLGLPVERNPSERLHPTLHRNNGPPRRQWSDGGPDTYLGSQLVWPILWNRGSRPYRWARQPDHADRSTNILRERHARR